MLLQEPFRHNQWDVQHYFNFDKSRCIKDNGTGRRRTRNA